MAKNKTKKPKPSKYANKERLFGKKKKKVEIKKSMIKKLDEPSKETTLKKPIKIHKAATNLAKTSEENTTITFDFRTSRRFINIVRDVSVIRGLDQSHTMSFLKSRLIKVLMSELEKMMGEEMSNKFREQWLDYLKRRVVYRAAKNGAQFSVSKHHYREQETDFMFFECLEEVATLNKWDLNGLKTVMQEPVQVFFTTNDGDKSHEFESAFIVIYARSGPKHKVLVCLTEDGVWSFPGGKKSSKCETIEECIAREIREETYNFSFDGIEKSIKFGPVCRVENSHVFAHKVEWKNVDEVESELNIHYALMKSDNKLLEFNAELLAEKVCNRSDEEFVDVLMDIFMQHEYGEEILSYKFVDTEEIANLPGGRATFLRKILSKAVPSSATSSNLVTNYGNNFKYGPTVAFSKFK